MPIQFIRKFAAKTMLVGLILASPLALSLPNGLAFAQEATNQDNGGSLVKKFVAAELVTAEDLGIENPGILTPNPFYFVKNFRRSTLRTLTFNPLKRADFELEVLNEKAAEIKLLLELNPKSESLEFAAANYQFTLDRMKTAFSNLKDSSSNAAVNQLLDKLTNRALTHLRLFDELKGRLDLAGKEKVDSLQSKLAGVLADTLERLDNREKLVLRLERAIEAQSGGLFKELRLAEILSFAEEQSEFGFLFKEAVLPLEENLLLTAQLKFTSEKIDSVLPAVLELLPGDSSRRIKTLDLAREYFSDSDLRNDIGQIRQLLLDLAARSRDIGKPAAETAVRAAAEATGYLKNALTDSGLRSNSLNTLLSRAEFNLKQAEESLRGGQPVSAFGQASIASAAAKNALNQLSQYQNVEKAIKDLKADYDELMDLASGNGLDGDNAPELFALFGKLEKSLVKLADLAVKDSKPDQTMAALRETKTILLEAKYLLGNLLQQLEEEAVAKRSAKPLIERVLQK
ncbi:MAG: hypothetical protein HYY86_03145 [Candidatus Harrisonbacteria bacterium]|nr:hypothetical protein [Candidatus Harrisonbacteria bacterium]